MMIEIDIGRTFNNKVSNGFSDQNDPEILEYLDKLKQVYTAFIAGRLYIKFVEGDREGSVAKVEANPNYNEPKEPLIQSSYSGRQSCLRLYNNRFNAIATWKGRRNKIQIVLPDREAIFLIGDNIETVWCKVDYSDLKAEIQKNPEQVDIDGTTLAVDDKVYYINARYGSRMTLSRGKIKEFKVVVNQNKTEITTVIEAEDGELSSISYPESMVCKIK